MNVKTLYSILVGPLPRVGEVVALEIVISDYFQIVIHIES